ncbi:MAG: DUF6935 domain-containing protein [Candidatus Helarchaeota archaeon]
MLKLDLTDLKIQSENATETPETAIKFVLNCLYLYQTGGKKRKGEDKALGYLGFVLSKSDLKEDKKSPSGFKIMPSTMSLIKGLKDPHRANAILSSMGATWVNNYQDIDVDDYELKVQRVEDLGNDRVKVFIIAGGRDNPFPLTLAKNNQGQWKIVGGFSTLCMDVRKPKSAVGDF